MFFFGFLSASGGRRRRRGSTGLLALSFPSPPHNICGGDEGQIPPFMSAAAGSRWSKSYQGIVPRRNF